jgi:hypothetical protein
MIESEGDKYKLAKELLSELKDADFDNSYGARNVPDSPNLFYVKVTVELYRNYPENGLFLDSNPELIINVERCGGIFEMDD